MLVKYVCSECYYDTSLNKCEFWTQYNEGMLVAALCPYEGLNAEWRMTKKYRKLLKKEEA